MLLALHLLRTKYWGKWDRSSILLAASGIALVYIGFTVHWVCELRGYSVLGRVMQSANGSTYSSPELQELGTVVIGGVALSWTDLQSFRQPLITATVFFGVSSATFVAAAIVVIRRNYRIRDPRAIMMHASITAMYILGAAYWSYLVAFNRAATLSFGDSSMHTGQGLAADAYATVPAVLSGVNTALSDMVILWRMCIIWNRRRSVLLLAIACSVMVFVLPIAAVTWTIKLRVMNAKLQSISERQQIITSALELASLIASLVSNLTATVLIGYQVWRYRRRTGRLFGSTTTAERVMLLLVESGALYAVIWIVFIIAVQYASSRISEVKIGKSWLFVNHVEAAMSQMTLYAASVKDQQRAMGDEIWHTIQYHEKERTTNDPEYDKAIKAFNEKHICRAKPFPEELAYTLSLLKSDDGKESDGAKVWAAVENFFDEWWIDDQIHLLDVPALLINGEFDYMTDAVCGPYFWRMNKVKWIKFAESSHTPMWEERERYMDAIRS
ncbi:hypothetical protein PENSPDRAFT_756104 [Peniophora sp. CONT]|nr:hypothetical protein PENSPDRAFT_756104 [Peniophora sp. CONT]